MELERLDNDRIRWPSGVAAVFSLSTNLSAVAVPVRHVIAQQCTCPKALWEHTVTYLANHYGGHRVVAVDASDCSYNTKYGEDTCKYLEYKVHGFQSVRHGEVSRVAETSIVM